MVAGCAPAARNSPPRDATSVTNPGDPPAAPSAAPSFLDRATPLGIDAVYHNGEEAGRCSILESLGGGVGWFDYDRDGWLDLVATGGSAEAAVLLLRSLGAVVEAGSFLIDLPDLGGKRKLEALGLKFHALLSFPGE